MCTTGQEKTTLAPAQQKTTHISRGARVGGVSVKEYLYNFQVLDAPRLESGIRLNLPLTKNIFKICMGLRLELRFSVHRTKTKFQK